MGKKLEVLEPKAGEVYDYTVDLELFNGKEAFAFTLRRKEGLPAALRNKAVIDAMTTWFDPVDFTIRGRQYHMQYNAGVYDFDVFMEVHLQPFQDLQVPVLIRYNGNWDVPFKKRERGVFTAKPCMVIQRLQRTPIAQIFRSRPGTSGSSQTPVSPGLRSPFRP